ncbi:tRNA pseudouridine(55) synthase TruB [Sanyastnella coralliicola]|uniref:tRNA pseudouridine(55) synthase TruB n=1 Tax=Sanyastnella coralliicola TaxID=3069118 RepID=UPI0027BA413E|nr:tRNA pseudouridine(55) synthase TruB [Longitalea sp. SCSIO 12813]
MIPKPNHFTQPQDFKDGVLLLIDKPLDWTSFDVVNKVRGMIRRKLGVRKIKVGHAGTLDPKATGLLVICTGKMTKQITAMIEEDKGYTGTMKFGAITPTYDLESEETDTFPIDDLSADNLAKAAQEFVPGYSQQAPIFSAKKIDGKPAYLHARKGREVEIPKRYVMIHEFNLTRVELPEVDFDVCCSKGTYIRSLAYDLGRQMNNGAYLIALRRYKSGKFHVNDAITVDTFSERLAAIPDPAPDAANG